MLALTMCLTLLSALAMPAFGQQAVCFYKVKAFPKRQTSAAPDRSAVKRQTKPVRAPSADYAQFEKASVTATSEGNIVEWQMESEKGNLGFFVYRDNGKGKQLVDEVMTTGSAALVGAQPLYGQTYSIFDQAGGQGFTYIIEAVGPFGERETTETGISGPADYAVSKPVVRDTSGSNIQRSSLLKAEAGETSEAADLTTHRWVVAQPGAKISVRAEGIYRVRLGELQAVSGIFTAANTANWRLFKEGIEQAVVVGSDATGPYLDFYGRPIDTRESDTRVYYLIVDAVNPGLRMTRTKAGHTGVDTATSYTAVFDKRERTTYIGTIFNGDAENWWGRAITGSSAATTTINLSSIDTSAATCLVKVNLQGWSYTGITPSVRVTLNGTLLGDITAPASQVPFSAEFTVPTSVIREGSNSLQMISNVSNNTELFESATITFARAFASIQNRLLFTTPNAKNADLTGFSSGSVRVFNVSNEDRPSLVNRVQIQQVGGTFTATVPPIGRGVGRKAIAVEDSGLLAASAITFNTPSTLSSTTQPADLIIISHSASDFLAAANTWADYRRTHDGMNVVVVDVADILDEYSYGSLSSAAIKSFLEYAKLNWPTQVVNKRYVLLLGDGSTDPRNYTGWGYFDQVPTMIVSTLYAETGSDEALADFEGNGLADMAVGRVPFRTAAAITSTYNKTVAYEANASLQNINRGMVLAYDVPNGYDFGGMSQDLAAQLPSGMPKSYVSRGKLPPYTGGDTPLTPDPDAHANLMSALNGGPYMVNYAGHGAQSFWAASNFLSNSSINSELNNSSNQSLYMMLTCLNGYFIGHNGLTDDSIAELMVKNPSSGGPMAWASTGLTTADVQMTMGRRFLTKVGDGSIPRIGDLVRDAKSVIPYGADVRFSWALFGDPMLKVR